MNIHEHHPITPFPINPEASKITSSSSSRFWHILIIVIFMLLVLFVIINFKFITTYLNELYDKYFLTKVQKIETGETGETGENGETPIIKALDLQNQPEVIIKANDDNGENPNGKRGFCYIGEERGLRTCIGVGINDTCMSGEIFPSMNKCINPNIRY